MQHENPYDMDSYCVKCQATTPEARYPAQLHTTGMMEWTCCACLGHGYKDDGVCTQVKERGAGRGGGRGA